MIGYDNGEVEIQLMEVETSPVKSDLIVQGIEVRPKQMLPAETKLA